jgi:two-component system, NtrC family, sensor kinase
VKRLRLSLPATILSALSLVLIITWILLGVVALKITERTLYDRKANEVRCLVTVLTQLLPEEIATAGESQVVAGFLATLAQDHEFRSLAITDAVGKMVIASPTAQGPDRLLSETLQKRQPLVRISDQHDTITRYAPLFSSSGSLKGAVRLTLTLTQENELLDRFRKFFLAYFALDFLLLLGLGSFLLTRLIVVPVRSLVTATHAIDAGDLSHRVTVSGTVETAELARSFNSMARSLARQRSEIEQNIVSLEAANRELHQAHEETIRIEKMASMGLLAAGMAHEVGTPLTAIMGYAGILRRELHDNPEQGKHLHQIEENTRRIDHIVRHLLEYARPHVGICTRADAGEIIRKALELLNSQGLFKQITINAHIPEDLPEIAVDGHQLHQVLINLLINARDAISEGGEIGLTVRKDDVSLEIEVRDTGEGILPENMDKIFDPFFTTKGPGKGTGLGLAICARIIDSFNGTISVQSRVGKGSTFTIRLPAAGD